LRRGHLELHARPDHHDADWKTYATDQIVPFIAFPKNLETKKKKSEFRWDASRVDELAMSYSKHGQLRHFKPTSFVFKSQGYSGKQ
jgi:hypothetical protein